MYKQVTSLTNTLKYHIPISYNALERNRNDMCLREEVSESQSQRQAGTNTQQRWYYFGMSCSLVYS